MSEPYDYGKRADELADAMRRYLIGINTGGIAATLTLAASMADKGIHPAWVFWPVVLFTIGLGISGGSLLFAKYKALERKKAVEGNKEIPKFGALHKRNISYELTTLIVFLVAAGFSVYELQSIDFVPATRCHKTHLPNVGSNSAVKEEAPRVARPQP